MMNTVEMSRGRLIEIDAETLHERLAADRALLVDVREPAEFAEAHIPGSVSIPLSTFDADDLPDAGDREIVLICAIGRRSKKAAEIIHASGRSEVTHLFGGLIAWEDAGFPTRQRSAPSAEHAAEGLLAGIPVG